ncbi:unnamed protein product [Cylicocyclus nassatus]|uniref:Methyltransferase domain-containing protein n=1 Tax=Cylicocyclus nassatus TaxID=53992 RepID=A0AA36MAS7_CYLNA|nr:unnamed protein product [Cylicocyclus nassatus]
METVGVHQEGRERCGHGIILERFIEYLPKDGRDSNNMSRYRYSISNTVLIAIILSFSLLFRNIKPKGVKMEVFREIRAGYVEQRLAQKPYFAPVAPHSAPSPRMIELYRIQVPQRRAYLEASLKYQIETYNFIYNNLAPEIRTEFSLMLMLCWFLETGCNSDMTLETKMTVVYCPELVRVGSTNDGGKWICSPFRIPKNCTIFSLGLFNEITFEQELQYIINKRCKIYAYDSSDQETKTMVLLSGIRTKFRKATIAAETDLQENEYSLKDLLFEANAEYIEIFKCDIEGTEFTVLPEFLEQHKPAQVGSTK